LFSFNISACGFVLVGKKTKILIIIIIIVNNNNKQQQQYTYFYLDTGL